MTVSEGEVPESADVVVVRARSRYGLAFGLTMGAAAVFAVVAVVAWPGLLAIVALLGAVIIALQTFASLAFRLRVDGLGVTWRNGLGLGAVTIPFTRDYVFTVRNARDANALGVPRWTRSLVLHRMDEDPDSNVIVLGPRRYTHQADWSRLLLQQIDAGSVQATGEARRWLTTLT